MIIYVGKPKQQQKITGQSNYISMKHLTERGEGIGADL